MSTAKEWGGARISLRPMAEADIDARYLSWFADDTVTQYLEAKNLSLEDARAYFRRGLATGEHAQFAVCDRTSAEMIGSVKIGPIHRVNLTSDLVTVIGERRYWGKGLASEAIVLANQIAFKDIGIRKLSGGMIAGNVGSIRCYTNAGWLVEGILKWHYVVDGRAEDRVVVSCFNPDVFPPSELASLRLRSAEMLASLGIR